MLIADEIVQDADILALDGRATSTFGDDNQELDAKRNIAGGKWLAARLEARGYPPFRHRIRRQPDAVFTQIGSVVADITTASTDAAADDVDLGAVWPGDDATNALLVMHRAPFRGVYFGVEEAVNAQTNVASPVVWTGAWTAVSSLSDGTRDGSASFGRGGTMSWQTGAGASQVWSPRVYNNTFGYWAKIHIASVTGTTAARQVLAVAESRLQYPAALHTLGLLYRDAWASGRGDWQEKSEAMFTMADVELQAVIGMVADEFDVDATGAVETTEVNSFRAADDPNAISQWERG